ncbi:hypothetical protein [Flavobacterium sp. DSR3-2]
MAIIENFNSLDYSPFKKKNIYSYDLFKAKEYTLKNVTPPPKNGYSF